MQPLVLLHAARIVEAFSAYRTNKRRLPGMSPDVDSQVSVKRESLPAIRAAVGSLARMGPKVVLQLRQLLESLRADVALMRLLSRVYQDVRFETADMRKRLPALVAFVGLLAGVDFVMRLQRRVCCKALSALVAQVSFFPVYPLMRLSNKNNLIRLAKQELRVHILSSGTASCIPCCKSRRCVRAAAPRQLENFPGSGRCRIARGNVCAGALRNAWPA